MKNWFKKEKKSHKVHVLVAYTIINIDKNGSKSVAYEVRQTSGELRQDGNEHWVCVDLDVIGVCDCSNGKRPPHPCPHDPYEDCCCK